MDRRQARIEAIRRHLHGESVISICSALNKSRRWFYYWVRRYSVTDGVWSEDRSRAPLHQRRKLPQSVERLVCEVRTRLLGRKYSQRGAVAIQWELRQLGVNLLPGIWTINRIIARHNLHPPFLPRSHRPNYPKLEAEAPSVAQQMDLVGPRYLPCGVRFYGIQ